MINKKFLRRLTALAVAVVTPQRPLLESVGKWREVRLPTYRPVIVRGQDEIGVTICGLSDEKIGRLKFG